MYIDFGLPSVVLPSNIKGLRGGGGPKLVITKQELVG